VGSASGLRAWLRLHPGTWLTAARLRLITAGLLFAAVLASGVRFG
jgi:hypothetical protein